MLYFILIRIKKQYARTKILLLNFKSTIGTSAFNEQKSGSQEFPPSGWAEFSKVYLSMAMEGFDMEEPCPQRRSLGVKRTIDEDFLF